MKSSRYPNARVVDYMVMKAILADEFYHDGRGPTLHRVHYGPHGATIHAIDFLNPDDGSLKHLFFFRPQVFCFTPEEVFDNDVRGIDWLRLDNAAIVDLGQSSWYQSFCQYHLARCRHFSIMFYDYYLDIICEGIEVHQGGYAGADVWNR